MSRDWTFFLEDIQESCSRVLRYTQDMVVLENSKWKNAR